MSTAIVIKSDGTIGSVAFDEKQDPEMLARTIGGWLQVVPFPDFNVEMWMHEEGKLIGLPVNRTATKLWQKQYGATDVIVGDVVLLGGADDEGYNLGLSPEDGAKLFVTLLAL